MTDRLEIALQRGSGMPLYRQVHEGIRQAILVGRLRPGDRLPSWQDLSAQLGLARSTIRAAYQRLSDERLVVGLGAAGTRVATVVPALGSHEVPGANTLLPEFFRSWEAVPPLPFQPGMPAADVFPIRPWARMLAQSAQDGAGRASYPNPRGELALRQELAKYLAVARSVTCSPDQIIVTAGFAGALGLAMLGLRLSGRLALVEEPSFPLTRLALSHAGMEVAAVPVDGEGLIVKDAEQLPAAVLVLTPGQHAPLGVTLSQERRHALLDWATRSETWIIEDDYLSELQLQGRAAPALAALDRTGRVLHAGTFSKTISPGLRLGFLVVPVPLADHFAEVAATLAPAPSPIVQGAMARFIAGGHYFRHLRRMKRLYSTRRMKLLAALTKASRPATRITTKAEGGLMLPLLLDPSADDRALAGRAFALGMAPVPLSPWYINGKPLQGLLIGVPTQMRAAWMRIARRYCISSLTARRSIVAKSWFIHPRCAWNPADSMSMKLRTFVERWWRCG